MSTQQIIFYFFSGLLLLSSALVVVSRHPVRAVLSLVLAFFAASGLWLLLEAEFLAITLILVYVGAVMVLFLFVVMMLDIKIVGVKEGFTPYFIIGAIAASAAVIVMMKYVGIQSFGLNHFAEPSAFPSDYSNVKVLGSMLYTTFVLPFEMAAVLLLVAIVAAISLTFRGRQASKGQSANRQAKVTKADRLRIVKLVSEKKPEGS